MHYTTTVKLESGFASETVKVALSKNNKQDYVCYQLSQISFSVIINFPTLNLTTLLASSTERD